MGNKIFFLNACREDTPVVHTVLPCLVVICYLGCGYLFGSELSSGLGENMGLDWGGNIHLDSQFDYESSTTAARTNSQ